MISRLIEVFLHKTKFSRCPPNLLCLGFRPANEGAQTNLSGIENYYPNTLLSHLKTIHWEIILQIIGDTGVSLILERCLLFVLVDAGAYLQITGPPLSELSSRENTVSPKAVIVRHKLLYAKPPSSVNFKFRLGAKRGALNIDRTGEILAKEIFVGLPNQEIPKNAAILNRFCKIAKYIKRKHKRCPYPRLLAKYCPEKDLTDIGESSGLELAECDYKVTGFLLMALNKILPVDIRKSEQLMERIKLKVSQFVRLRKNESMSVDEILDGISFKQCDWLPKASRSKSDQEMLLRSLKSFVYWIFNSYLVALVRTYFYVTDSSAHRQRLFYFCHEVWKISTAPFLSELKERMFTLSENRRSRSVDWDQLGTCNLRLIPKGPTFRPVMNLRKRIPRNGSASGASINSLLKNVHQVLTHAVKLQPEILGSSVLGLDEVSERLSSFKKTGVVENCPLFFVKVDFKACFDSIPHDKLLHILAHKIVPKDDFTIQRYDVLKSIHGKVWKIFKKFASSSSDFVGLAGHIANGSRTRTARILVDRVVGSHTDRHKVIKLLHEHICSNHVVIERRLYTQKVGIPQGSILSSILCSILYGDLDRTLLGAFLNDPESLMVRFIDDMLFVTTSYTKASEFIHTVLPGFQEYGVEVNLSKIASNFYHPLVKEKILANQDFPWCGLLLDQETLEVRGDYSKMFGSYLKDSLSVQRVCRPVDTFLRQLKIFLKPKLKPVFLMTELNSHQTICVNIYQNFVYVAIKTHLYLRELRGIAVPRPALLLKAIDEACEFVASSLKSVNGTSPSSVPVRWFGIVAFRRVFELKPTAYRGIVLDTLLSLSDELASMRPYQLDYDRVFCSDQVLFQNLLW